MKVIDHATRQPVWQELIHQCEGCEPARKSVDHDAAGAEHTSAIPKERSIIANMLHDGAGDDEIGRAVPKRKLVRRRVGNDLVIELPVVAQLLVGKIKRHDQMLAGRVDEWQERALFAPADIDYGLSGPAIEQLRDFVLIQGLNVALEQCWQAIFSSLAQPLVRFDKTRKQRHRLQPKLFSSTQNRSFTVTLARI